MGYRGLHMHTGAHMGLQGVLEICTGADRGCTVDDRENTGDYTGRQQMFIRTEVFRASSVICSQNQMSLVLNTLQFKKGKVLNEIIFRALKS